MNKLSRHLYGTAKLCKPTFGRSNNHAAVANYINSSRSGSGSFSSNSSSNNSSSFMQTQMRHLSIDEKSWAAKGLTKETDVAKKSENSLEFFASVADFKNTEKYPENVRKVALDVMSLSVVECHQLMQLIQTKLGISDEALFSSFAAQFGLGGGSGAASVPSGGGAAPAASAAGGAAPAAAKPAEEKTAFNLKLTAVDATSKIKVIKEVRTITGLGLKEAKDLVEKAPTMIKEGLKKEEADSFKKLLESVGAKVELL
jgi:large subunit ribosomal protein L7/L12